MTGLRRVLIATAATPGGEDWRRFAMWAEFYRDLGAETVALALVEGAPGAAAAALFRRIAAHAGFAAPEDAAGAIAALDLRMDFDAIHFAAPVEASIMAGARGVRIVDGAPARFAAAAPHADIFVALDEEGAEAGRRAGRPAISAPWLGRGERKPRARAGSGAGIAGVWVDSGEVAAAVSALLEAGLGRGGAHPPRFLLAGPEAGAVRAPALPYPPTCAPDAPSERVLYRAADLALFPLPESAPFLKLVTALELGAAPLFCGAPKAGAGEGWALPTFAGPEALGEYLFEHGADLGQGGAVETLQKSAGRTWRRLARASEAARAALTGAIREAAKARSEDERN